MGIIVAKKINLKYITTLLLFLFISNITIAQKYRYVHLDNSSEKETNLADFKRKSEHEMTGDSFIVRFMEVETDDSDLESISDPLPTVLMNFVAQINNYGVIRLISNRIFINRILH